MAEKDPWLSVPFQQLSREVDRLFDELIYRRWKGQRAPEADWIPQLDLYEDEHAFVLEADLPGVHEQDIAVAVEEGSLVLRGKRTFERSCEADSFHCQERRSGEFVRRLPLPVSIDQTQIRAEFQNGVLRVTLPKLPRSRSAPVRREDP